MAVNRDALRRFLEGNAKNETARELVSGTMAELEPFFLTVESGRYGSRCRPIPHREVVQAIESALVSPPNGVRILAVRFNQLLPRLCWMTEEAYTQALKDLGLNLLASLDTDFRTGLQASFRDSLQVGLGDKLGEGLGADLWGSLRNSLGLSPRNSLQDSLGLSPRDSLGDCLEAGLFCSLFFICGFALVGYRERWGRLRPLVRLLPSVIPLGTLAESTEAPGAWLCLDLSLEEVPDSLFPGGRCPAFLKRAPA